MNKASITNLDQESFGCFWQEFLFEVLYCLLFAALKYTMRSACRHGDVEAIAPDEG